MSKCAGSGKLQWLPASEQPSKPWQDIRVAVEAAARSSLSQEAVAAVERPLSSCANVCGLAAPKGRNDAEQSRRVEVRCGLPRPAGRPAGLCTAGGRRLAPTRAVGRAGRPLAPQSGRAGPGAERALPSPWRGRGPALTWMITGPGRRLGANVLASISGSVSRARRRLVCSPSQQTRPPA